MDKLSQQLNKLYNFKVKKLTSIPSYYKGVFEITTTKQKKYILKTFYSKDSDIFRQHRIMLKICKHINSKSDRIKAPKFVLAKNKKTLMNMGHMHYFFVMQKENIVLKSELNPKEQVKLGSLLKNLHLVLKSCRIRGLRNSFWMTNFSGKEKESLKQYLKEDEYRDYLFPYKNLELNLPNSILHADLHQRNISFIRPTFLFDFDHICEGKRIEEIARTIVSWDSSIPQTILYKNILKGYKVLTSHEIKILPKLILNMNLKKVAEFHLNKDFINVQKTLKRFHQVQQLFNLNKK